MLRGTVELLLFGDREAATRKNLDAEPTKPCKKRKTLEEQNRK